MSLSSRRFNWSRLTIWTSPGVSICFCWTRICRRGESELIYLQFNTASGSPIQWRNGVKPGQPSIFGRPLGMIDYQNLYRALARFQFQAQLLLQNREDGRAVGAGVARNPL